jgi:hypothetical protein
MGLPRSTLYYQPAPVHESILRIMAKIDVLYLEDPFSGQVAAGWSTPWPEKGSR